MTPHLRKQKVLLSALSIAVTLALVSPLQAHANSSVRNEMNKMFGSMSNVSAPGVFETSRRGVISGGSVVVRNRIMNTNIAAFQPPSFSGGCGGIDMFGGSFSFINKEQFVQLARSIASNAASYAFYLAVETMAPSVSMLMDKIQAKIQDLNGLFSNSCQLAQGVVNDAVSSIDFKRDIKGATSKSFKEGFGDVFESFTAHSGSGPREETSAETKKSMSGNIVWDALKDRQVASWYTYGGDNLNSAIMTVTGTVIIGEQKEAPDGMGPSAEYITVPSGLTTQAVRFETLVKGGEIQVYECDTTSACLSPSFNTSTLPKHNIVGFEQLIRNNLNGTDGTGGGIIGKVRSGQNLTEAEKNFLNALPTGMGGMIFRLARISDETARSFVTNAAEPMGRDMAYELLSSFSDTAITATLSMKDNPAAKEGVALLRESKNTLTEQYRVMSDNGVKVGQLIERYNNILQATAKLGISPDLYMPGATPASSGQN